MKYGLIGKFKTRPGKRDELVAILLKAAAALEKNPDCIHYLISISNDSNAVWVTETWTSKEAHDAALKPAHIKALIQEGLPLVASMPKQIKQSIIGGKGVT